MSSSQRRRGTSSREPLERLLLANILCATVDELKSTEKGYVFTGTVGAIAAGEYTMCYCDDQTSPGDTTSSESKYVLTQDYVCDIGLANYSVLTTAAKSDLCTVKCAQGCTGADCFCDSFDPA